MPADQECQRLVAIWTLRAILRPQAFRGITTNRNWNDENILLQVGLGHLLDQNLTPRELKMVFSQQLRKFENAKGNGRQELFFQNLNRLGDMIGLSAGEREILIFALLVQEEQGLKIALDYLDKVNVNKFIDEIADIIKIKPDEAHRALSQNKVLCASGLIELEDRQSLTIPPRLTPLDGLGRALRCPDADLEVVLSTYFVRCPASCLQRSDFTHLEKDLKILYPFLRVCVQDQIPGVNVLLVGPPGTGKTELARMVAHDLGSRLYEVGTGEHERGHLSKKPRFRSYLLCQSCFARCRDCLVLFDEVEDVFPVRNHSIFGLLRQSGEHKGWTNRLLESNPLPTIWISNSVSHVDPAFIRRFDLVLEVPVPPRSVRQQIFQKIVQNLPVRPEYLTDLSHNDYLAPAHLEKAVKVTGLVGVNDQEATEGMLSRVIGNLHKALGLPTNNTTPKHLRAYYDLQFANADCDLQVLIRGCQEQGQGRICLFGPPGTGKTAFVHFLAQQLERPVLVRRASDILGPLVGQTEHGIAAMFSAAAEQQAILLLDEADSFLQDRRRAQHSWEITQVNELLVQMEAFAGLFFCATNLITDLDNAVFRRYDLKIKFDYLRPEQAWGLFKTMLQQAGQSLSEAEARLYKPELGRLIQLTPGDFATVKRQCRLLNRELVADTLLAGLQKELAAKPEAVKHPVGFLLS